MKTENFSLYTLTKGEPKFEFFTNFTVHCLSTAYGCCPICKCLVCMSVFYPSSACLSQTSLLYIYRLTQKSFYIIIYLYTTLQVRRLFYWPQVTQMVLKTKTDVTTFYTIVAYIIYWIFILFNASNCCLLSANYYHNKYTNIILDSGHKNVYNLKN